MAKRTSVSVSSKQVDFVSSPAITILPSWNSSVTSFLNRPEIVCTKTNETMWNCLQQFIFNISDIIIEETHPGAWTFELTDPVAGPYYSRGNFFNMTTKFQESYGLFMNTGVNNTLADTKIALHDPTYFISNSNPATLPKISVQGESDEPFERRVYIEAIKVMKLNMPLNPCEPLTTYSYKQCVHEYVTKVLCSRLVLCL